MAKVSKRAKKQEELKEQTKQLTHDEHLAVETLPMIVENAKLLMAVEEQSLVNMILELKLLEAKIVSQKQKVSECNARYTAAKSKHQTIVSQIIAKHDLKTDSLSYNNNTREIIL